MMELQHRVEMRKADLANTASLVVELPGSVIRLHLRNDGELPIEHVEWSLQPLPDYWERHATFTDFKRHSGYEPLEGAAVQGQSHAPIAPGERYPLLELEFDVAVLAEINTGAIVAVDVALTYAFGTRHRRLSSVLTSSEINAAASESHRLGPLSEKSTAHLRAESVDVQDRGGPS